MRFIAVVVCLFVLSPSLVLCAPATPSGLCINDCSNTASSKQAGFFPGTNLKFYPGIIIRSNENESPKSIEANWQALFSHEKNRKQTYRPPGVYGGVTVKLKWYRYYKDSNRRPDDPLNHKDPAYDWSKLDAALNINAVQNEGAMVALQVGESSAPNWIKQAPYDGVFLAQWDKTNNKPKTPKLKYYRYEGPDNRGQSHTDNQPPIVEELVYFHQALYNHLVDTGNIDKVMFLTLAEVYVNSPQLPSDFNSINLQHGIGVRNEKVAKIWGASNIAVLQSSLTGPYAPTMWQYMDDPTLGITFPDMKMSGTNNISGSQRFTHPDGTDQKDIRPLAQAIEANGLRSHTYFAPDIPNPWGYSGYQPQTMSHIVWALSGSPKGENKDSGLGQVSEDPPGVMPVHNIIVSWTMTWAELNPTLEEWHEAFDTFGPAGTFAFPYLPKGYQP